MPVSHIHQTNSFFVNFDLSPVGIHEQKNRRMRTEQRSSQKCDPEDLVLEEFQQWRDEVGYWIGEYSFYGSDGNANQSVDWNYPFDHYRGFITGNIKKNAYRQRNVFLYPPQDKSQCPNDVSYGNGVCGLNGNTKIFYADQSATMCPKKKEDFAGNIEGPYGDFFYTTTELVGGNSALLYQVFLKKRHSNCLGLMLQRIVYIRANSQLSPEAWMAVKCIVSEMPKVLIQLQVNQVLHHSTAKDKYQRMNFIRHFKIHLMSIISLTVILVHGLLVTLVGLFHLV